jgi:hypothetical protein
MPNTVQCKRLRRRHLAEPLRERLLVVSAAIKLSRRPAIVESYARLGVEARHLPLLAGVLLLGAGGLVAGLLSPSLGLVTAICLTIYFAVTVAVHVHARVFHNIATPVLLAALAVVSTVLHLWR